LLSVSFVISLFSLEAMATICKILSSSEDDLWHFTTSNGRKMGKAIAFVVPFIADKVACPFESDIMYWNEWPVWQPFLLFSAQAFKEQNYMTIYKQQKRDMKLYDGIQNVPKHHPILWSEKIVGKSIEYQSTGNWIATNIVGFSLLLSYPSPCNFMWELEGNVKWLDICPWASLKRYQITLIPSRHARDWCLKICNYLV